MPSWQHVVSPDGTTEDLSARLNLANAAQSALAKKWWDTARPNRRGAVVAKPGNGGEVRAEFHRLFEQWLECRGLKHHLNRCADATANDGSNETWAVFNYMNPVILAAPHWETAFHGTRWYALWSLLETGVLLESNDDSKGHDFWVAGAYCTPRIDTARWYARPAILFDDGTWHRVMLELRVNRALRRKARNKGGVQWVYPSNAVAIKAVCVLINTSLTPDDERFATWDPELEAVPPGRSMQQCVTSFMPAASIASPVRVPSMCLRPVLLHAWPTPQLGDDALWCEIKDGWKYCSLCRCFSDDAHCHTKKHLNKMFWLMGKSDPEAAMRKHRAECNPVAGTASLISQALIDC